MERQNIIIVTKNHIPDASKMVVEAWGSLTECCKAHGFPYHSLKAKRYPFEYEEWYFKKVPFRALANKWVSVNERLPIKYKYVTVITDNNYIGKDQLGDNKEFVFAKELGYKVTHWLDDLNER